MIKAVDDDATRGRVGRQGQQGVEFELKPLDKPVNILVGEVEKIKNPRSGKMMTAMIENKFTPTPMPDYGLFTATKSLALPRAYLFRNEDGMKTIIDKLLAHGVAIEELTEPLTTEVESFVIDDVKKAARAFQGHAEVKLKGRFAKRDGSIPRRLDSGSNFSTFSVVDFLSARSGERRRIRELEFSRSLSGKRKDLPDL